METERVNERRRVDGWREGERKRGSSRDWEKVCLVGSNQTGRSVTLQIVAAPTKRWET